MTKALIVQGGWDGHQPVETTDLMAKSLRERDVDVTVSDTLDYFANNDLTVFDVIVPHWTMGTIAKEQLETLLAAIKGGVGAAGIHGGMGDAFRAEPEYQHMVGGQWVAHPGDDGVRYMVHIDGEPSPITDGIDDFEVVSEQYYLHVDPVNRVLATTRFGDTVMPVTWTKHYGEGRVFYCSLGHQANIVAMPPVLEMVTRGILWAGGALADGS